MGYRAVVPPAVASSAARRARILAAIAFVATPIAVASRASADDGPAAPGTGQSSTPSAPSASLGRLLQRAGAEARRADGGPISPIPPDPAPTQARGQWVYDLRYDNGDIYLLGTRRFEVDGGQLTPRAMGRFAVELYEGPALIERVRFDFPLLGGDEPADSGWNPPPSFTRHLVSRIGVVFPESEKGNRLELWDRATGRRWDLPFTPAPQPPPRRPRAPSGG